MFYFGTGDSSTADVVTYNYTKPGTYDVTLKYTNAAGCIKEVVKKITIGATCNLAAGFTVAQNLTNPLSFSFKNSTKPDTTTIAYKWFFGNGDSSTTKSPNYTYLNSGTYKVTLIATRTANCVSAKDTTITIAPLCNLTAKFIANQNSINPSSVTFTNQSYPDSSNTTYKWYFGNGDSSITKNPAYNYPAPGTFKVQLIAKRGICTSATDTTLIIPSLVVSITSFSPQSGPVGTRVIITGTNFSTTASDNIVYFGAVKAVVLSSTATQLSVIVPPGATYRPITVTVKNLVAYAAQPFNVTFSALTNGFTPTSFSAKIDSAMGTRPMSITLCDYDGDGKPDVSVGNYGNSISVRKNTSSNGTISLTPKKDYAITGAVRAITYADFDGDGKEDMVAAIENDYTGVAILKNTSANGVVSFAAEQRIDLLTLGGFSVAAGDLDGDGKVDLAVVGYYSNRMSVLKNTSANGVISFAPQADYGTGSSPLGVTIADLDGDGKPEVLVANSWVASLFTPSSVSVYRNTSNNYKISFAAKVDVLSQLCSSVAVGDLDGDGKPEIVTGNNGSTISVLKNVSVPGTISFRTNVDYSTGGSPKSVSIADLDGDGKPDIVTANNSSSTVSVLKNLSTNSAISFSPKADYLCGKSPYGIAIGDLNADGKPDITVANSDDNTMSILQNNLAAAADSCKLRADFSFTGTTVAPAVITFSNQTSPDTTVTYKWFFANGDSSTLKNPVTTFTVAGTYKVYLSATDPVCKSSKDTSIVITSPTAVCNINAKFSRNGATTAPAAINFINQTTPDSTANTFKWYFGNGDSSILKNPSYTYTSAGTYNVRLIATRGTCTSSYIDTVIITSPAAVCSINAKFTRSGSTTAPASINFINQTTPDSTANTFKWYFGNGDSSTLRSPSYTYTSAGTYNVRLIATRGTCTSSYIDTVIITSPVVACNINAKFTRSGSTTAPASINFINQTTPDSTANTFKWYFGNGDSSTAKNPSYTYVSPGTYYVRLIATRGTCASSYIDTVVITSPAVVCNINAKFTRNGSTTVPASINFINLTLPDTTANAFKWYFGNGDSSTAKNPSYAYFSPGIYYVRLVATRGTCASSYIDTVVTTSPAVVCNINAKFT
jgi:PKD repeat protein